MKRICAAIIAAVVTLTLGISASARSYTVQPGDSLWSIAQKHATTVTELQRLNSLNSTAIMPGTVLKVSEPASNAGELYIEYKVQKGDTLGKIAESFGTKAEFIRSLNGLSGDIIYTGSRLMVPCEYFEHQVKAGDTLWKLSQTYNTTTQKIMVYSGIEFTDLRVGQILKIPSASAGTPAPVPTTPSAPVKTYFDYTVVSGDTIWTVSVKFGIPMQELLSDNGLNSSSVLNLGQKLKIAKYTIPVKATPGAQYGEFLDWWTQAQYVCPINKVMKVTDFLTKKTFTIKRTVGAGHADCEPLTASDTAAAKAVFGGFTWNPRAVIVECDGRRIAASMSFYPHDISYITNNGFNGHFDLYFSNCIRHTDGKPDASHQAKVELAAGLR